MQRINATVKGFATPLFWICSACLLVSLFWTTYKRFAPLNVRAASFVPYTVQRTERGFDQAGSLKYVNRYLDAMRADGSTVKQVATSVENRRTINLAGGEEVRVNELFGKKSTYPKKFAEIPTRDPSSSCRAANDTKWVFEGEESVEGHRAARQVLSDGGRKMTAWYALDAQCALLQLRFEHEEGLTVQSLTSLTVGEPAKSLFEVASSYQEVPPSALLVSICKDGKTCSSLPVAVAQRLDKNYYALRTGTR